MQTKMQGSKTLVEELCDIPGGEGVRLCIQCGTCSASCPNANRMDYTPRELIAMARAGMRDEVLSSNSMWLCLSCYLCTVRCPRGIKPTEFMHALEYLAIRDKLSSGRTRTPAMYRTFVDSMKSNGRVHEFGFMLRYYLKTNPFAALKMATAGLKLLSRGRMPLRPTKIKGIEELKAIVAKAQTLGGDS